jgi:protein-tyrosine phosphatase
MLECHCHVLPAVDDGAPDLATGLAMIATMVDGGIRQLVATPHRLHPQFESSDAQVVAAFAQIQAATAERWPELRLHLGAENHFAGTLQDDDFIAAMRPLGDSRSVLVELPDQLLPRGVWSTLFRLHVQGWRPVLAHVERCRPLGSGEYDQELLRFVRAGGLLQITLGALLRCHGWRVWWRARRLVRRFPGHCVLVSDAHDLGARRPRWQQLPLAWRHLTRPDLAGLVAN